MALVRIIGIDPGLRNMGWGMIDVEGSRLIYVAAGSVHSDAKRTLAERLKQLHDGLTEVIQTYQPQEAAVEETFVNTDPQATLKLGQARGIALVFRLWRGWKCANMAPTKSKKLWLALATPKRRRCR